MSFLAGDIMKITYINHSGFLVETKDCYYIFDYYKGELPFLDKKKEVIVFCSQFHEDHFNPKIFEILDEMGMTYQAVLSKDIRKKNKRSDMKITYAYHDKHIRWIMIPKLIHCFQMIAVLHLLSKQEKERFTTPVI